jgi:hypothetical protein
LAWGGWNRGPLVLERLAQAICHGAVSRRPRVRAIACHPRRQARRIGRAEGLLGFTPRGGATRHPRPRRGGARLAGACAREGPLGHQSGGAVGEGSRRQGLLADRTTRVALTAGAAERRHPAGDTRLVRHAPRSPHRLAVRPMSAASASRAGKDGGGGSLVAVVAATTRDTRALEGGHGRGHPQRAAAGAAMRRERAVPPSAERVAHARPQAASWRGAAVIPGGRRREGGVFGQNRGTRERCGLTTPRPVRPLAVTVWPAVTRRSSGVCWVAWASISPLPRASNLPAPRPRCSQTGRRSGGGGASGRSSAGEERLQDCYRTANMAQAHASMLRGRCGKSATPVHPSIPGLQVRLPQDLQDMPPALQPCIQEEPAVMRQRHLARHGNMPATDQPHIRDGVMRGTTRAGRDQRRAGTGAAGDAVDAGGLDGFGQARRRQDSGQPARQAAVTATITKIPTEARSKNAV